MKLPIFEKEKFSHEVKNYIPEHFFEEGIKGKLILFALVSGDYGGDFLCSYVFLKNALRLDSK